MNVRRKPSDFGQGPDTFVRTRFDWVTAKLIRWVTASFAIHFGQYGFQPTSKMGVFFRSWQHWHDTSIESLDLLRPMALWTPNPPARSAASEAHRAMAIAMNRIGGKSNTGEGGEEQNVVWMFCLNNLWSPSLLLMPSEQWKNWSCLECIHIVLQSIGGILITKPLWNPKWPTSSVERFFVAQAMFFLLQLDVGCLMLPFLSQSCRISEILGWVWQSVKSPALSEKSCCCFCHLYYPLHQKGSLYYPWIRTWQ